MAGAALLVGAGCLAAFKAGLVGTRPALLATLMAIAGTAAAIAGTASAVALARGRGRVAAAGETSLFAGVAAMAAAGLWNWLVSVQGVVLLQEREPVVLSRAEDVTAVDLGPLADRAALELTVALARLRLEAVGLDGFQPVSALKLLDAAGTEVGVLVRPREPARHGALIFRQGAFGFSPRLVITRGGRTVLDAQVPFRTVLEGGTRIAFHGEVDVPEEDLRLEGAVTLEDLNDEMKGHPRLELAVTRGRGPPAVVVLKPGEQADLGEGLQVAFTGLRRWSEVDFARRTYPVPILAGAALFALGALLWPLAAWRGW